MSFKSVTTETFDAEVLKSEQNVLVEFGAEWCKPCEAMTPILQKFSSENESVKVCTIDIDDNYELTTQFKVRGVPMFVAFKNGTIVNTISGTCSLAKLNEMFK